jgi:hypothetical protein
VIPGPCLCRENHCHVWKDLCLTENKICAEYFGGLLEEGRKKKGEKES